MLKLKMMLWCDDVAAGRRRLQYQQSVSQCVKFLTTASGVDNAASPRLADTAESRLFHPRERPITMQNNWKEPRSILMSREELPISMGNSCNYCEHIIPRFQRSINA